MVIKISANWLHSLRDYTAVGKMWSLYCRVRGVMGYYLTMWTHILLPYSLLPEQVVAPEHELHISLLFVLISYHSNIISVISWW